MTLTDAYAMAKRVKGEASLEHTHSHGTRSWFVINPQDEEWRLSRHGIGDSRPLSVTDALSDAWEVHAPDGRIFK